MVLASIRRPGVSASAAANCGEDEEAPLVESGVSGRVEMVHGNTVDLKKPIPPKPSQRHPVIGIMSTEDWGKGSFFAETWRMLSMAMPLILLEATQYLHTVIGLIVVGRLGAVELSVAVLGSAVYSTTGFSIMVGLSSAMETLCGQAYGAEEYGVLGEVLQRATLILALVALPIVWFWWNVGYFLLLAGQHKEIAGMAAEYVRWLIPGLFGILVTENCKCFLRSQNVVAPTVWITVASLVASPPLFYLMVFHFKFGAKGAAMVSSLLWALESVAFVIYIGYVARKANRTPGAPRCWRGFSRNMLHGWGGYIKVAVPSAAMLCLEWWAFEIVVFMGGTLPEPELQVAAMGIGFNIIQVSFMAPYGLSQAVSVRVANELGAGNARGARTAAQVAIAMAVVSCILASLLLLVCRFHVVGIFTSDLQVIHITVKTLLLVALAVAFDGMNTVMCGVLRGSGRQFLGSLVVSVHYIVGLPISAVGAFHLNMGVVGLWIGLACATAVEAVGLIWTVHFTDWESQGDLVGAKFSSEGGAP